MFRKYLVFLAALVPLFINGQPEVVTFLGEIRFKGENSFFIPNDLKIKTPYHFFKNRYTLRLYISHNGEKEKLSEDSFSTYKKESYDQDVSASVEIRINIDSSIFVNPKGKIRLIGSFNPTDYQYNNCELSGQGMTVDLKIPSDDKYIINNKTFKFNDALKISAPEEVSLTILLDYLDYRLNNPSNETHDYNNLYPIVSLLKEGFSSVQKKYSSEQLKKYYRLLYFLEPFVLENTFFQNEARLLSLKIKEQFAAPFQPTDSTTERKLQDSLTYAANLAYAEAVYNRYEAFNQRIQYYYKELHRRIFGWLKYDDQNSYLIGTLKTVRKVKQHEKPKLYKELLCDSVVVKEVFLDFRDGEIVNIRGVCDCEVRNETKVIIYENKTPIRHSLNNRGTLRQHVLYPMNVDTAGVGVIYLEDLIRFTPILDQGSNNFPSDVENGDFYLQPDGDYKRVYKNSKVDLFQLELISDAIGWGGEQPNGVAQFIASKRFAANKTYIPLGNSYNYIIPFNYVRPNIAITKLEKRNKYFLADTISIGETDTISSLNLLKYSNLNTGFRVNGLTLGMGKLRSELHIGLGIHAFSTSVERVSRLNLQENELQQFSVTSVGITLPSISWNINQIDGMQLLLRYDQLFIQSNSDRLVTIGNGLLDKGSAIHSFELVSALTISKNIPGNLLFKFQYLFDNEGGIFTRIQLGCSFPIVSNPSIGYNDDKRFQGFY